MLSKAIVVLEGNKDPLPADYPRSLTAAILAKIGEKFPDLADALHDGKTAYRKGNKFFKPLSHSLLVGASYNTGKKCYEPGEVISFYLGWREDVVAAFKSAAKKNAAFEVADAPYRIVAVADINPSPPGRQFRAWGPVIATISGKKQGKEISYTYAGTEDMDSFKSIVKNNLTLKYEAIFNKPYEGRLEIEIDRPRDVILKWSDKISTRGVVGLYRLDCADELLALAHAVGLGSKNSIGFGCLMSA